MGMSVWTGTRWVGYDFPRVWTGTEWKSLRSSYWDGYDYAPEAIIGAYEYVSTNLSWSIAEPTPLTKTYSATKTFSMAWGHTYQGDGSKRNDKTDLYQGYYNSMNGNQRSLFGFNISGIPGNANITKAELTLHANHWYNNSGGTVLIGTHNHASEPGSFGGANTDRLRHTWNEKTGSRTINVGNTIGQEILNGSVKGFSLGPAPSNSTDWYGYFAGSGSLKPVLKVSYTYVA